MNYEDLYDYTFNKLIGVVKERKAVILRRGYQQFSKDSPLLKLGDMEEEEVIYGTVKNSLKRIVPNAISNLLILMLTRKYGMDETSKVIPVYGSLEEPTLGYVTPHFAIRGNCETVGYICANEPIEAKDLISIGSYEDIERAKPNIRKMVDEGSFKKGLGPAAILDLKNLPKLNGITCVVLAALNPNIIEHRNKIAGRFAHQTIPVNYVLFNDFFTVHFGEEELSNFYRRVESFNAQVQKETAVSIIGVPTAAQMVSLKEEYLDRIVHEAESYKDELAILGIDNSQYEVIRKHFFDDGLYLGLVGTADYADSFVSSEWMMGLHHLTEVLDQTGAVAGYLKSIEQLLYIMVKQWKNKGRRIPKHYDKNEGVYDETVPFDDSFSDEELFRLTGGSLACFFHPKANAGILYLNNDAARRLFSMLREFFSNDRNYYFHKTNLHCACSSFQTASDEPYESGRNELERIRHETMLLHFLILGSCIITDDCWESLGIPQDYSSNRLIHGSNEGRFRSWFESEFNNPIVRFRLSEGVGPIVFSFSCNQVESDSDNMYSKNVSTRAMLRLNLFEKDYDFRADPCQISRGIYESVSSLKWTQDGSRNQAFSWIIDQLSHLDWDALLSWSDIKPKVLIRDTFSHEQLFIRE